LGGVGFLFLSLSFGRFNCKEEEEDLSLERLKIFSFFCQFNWRKNMLSKQKIRGKQQQYKIRAPEEEEEDEDETREEEIGRAHV
jgi:hypothetical protein